MHRHVGISQQIRLSPPCYKVLCVKGGQTGLTDRGGQNAVTDVCGPRCALAAREQDFLSAAKAIE